MCTKSQMSEQVKGLAGNVESRDVVVRGKDCWIKPSQKKDVNPVSGRGRKEGKVNVVSPEQGKFSTNTTTTSTTVISRDHDDKRSEGVSDSEDEDADVFEEVGSNQAGRAKIDKPAHKAKPKKKGKKKKGRKRK